MLLAIDVGNTDTVIGVFEDESEKSHVERSAGEVPRLANHWRIATRRERSADEFALILGQFLDTAGIVAAGLNEHTNSASRPGDGERRIGGLALCSSVPSVTSEVRVMATRLSNISLVVVEAGVKTGMAIRIDNPKEVGADRVANAVAALDLYDPPAIVVDLGTATTFDAISSAGEYLGGAIVPGIGIAMDALVSHAAALRRVELVEPRAAIGRNTVEAMQSGAIFGYASLVDGLCKRIEAELGTSAIVATGGFSALVAPYAASVAHIEPWLTLHGLRLIFERNAVEGGDDGDK